MIEHEKTDSGGSVRVKSADGHTTISFSLSNPDRPLSLLCDVDRGSSPRLSVAVIGSLAERYSPSVLVVQSEQTELRYTPKMQSLFRCWTYGKQSVFAEAFSSRSMFDRICSLSCAMQNTDFVRASGDSINLYGYHSVLAKIRQNTTPFEFLNIKEDCDHNIKGVSARCVDRITAAAIAALPLLSTNQRPRFEQVLQEISNKQSRERGYDTRFSYIQEVATGVLLPAVVNLGGEHPFTRALFNEFSQTTAEYVTACERFLLEYSEINGQD